ncbi:hypothetical protein TQ33_1499 [Kangiella geojedonensis]|uniref:Uncharacterized protein n=2 Tax=Kangiella geojedonensis TaxID=914150 RepID=A0A0F6RCY4_9GAMM|nr:hypothetical protein TQ33_1499 [Kangiella geojedonensis]
MISFMTVMSCANQQSQMAPPPSLEDKKIQPVCSAPPPPQNIWKLEPVLKEKGLITEDMTRPEKEQVIRDYINKKNSAYIKCVKGKK